MRQVPPTTDSSCLINTQPRQRSSQLAHTYALVFNAHFGFYLLNPLLTFIFFASNSSLFSPSTSLAERSLLYGLCLSLMKAGGFFANTIIPSLSDHFGRKLAWKLSLFALVLVASLGLMGLLWQQPTLFISAFCLHGLLDANKSTGLACISDLSHEKNRLNNMGTLQAMIAAGACIGPVVGGYSAEIPLFTLTPYTLPFMLALLIGIASLWIVYQQPETYTPNHQQASKLRIQLNIKQIFSDYLHLLKQKKILQLFVILSLSQLSWASYYEFIGPLLKLKFDFHPNQLGLFMGLIAFSLVLSAGLILRILTRWLKQSQLINLAVSSVACGALLTVFAAINHTLWFSQALLWLSAIPIAMGDVIIYTLLVNFLSQQAGSSNRGKAMGLNLIVTVLIWSGVALLGGYLITFNALGAMLFMPLGILLLLLYLFLFKKKLWFLQAQT